MPILPLLVPASAASPDLEETEFQLFVTPNASKLPADRNSYYATVQLQVVENGKPIEAPLDMEITLISSDPSVISLPESKFVLSGGESTKKIELVTTDKAGVASITALAEGTSSYTTSVTTYRMDSLEPTRLAINAAPSSFIPDPQYVGMIYIQILNSQNLPTTSNNDLTVDLSSSDPTIGRLPSYVVIPARSSGIIVDFTPQKQTGMTMLRASAPGLAPGELAVNVEGPVASNLVVEFAPNVIPAVSYHDSMMTVQLTDEDGNPVRAAKTLKVSVKSSDTAVVEVPMYVEILAGNSYATAFVKSKGAIGSATITASATGYGTGIGTIDTVQLSEASSSDPKVLRLYSVPSILPPDNSEHQAIIVAFLDEDGLPYRQTGYLYQRIALSTSNVQVGEITSTTLTTKETYAMGKFETKYAIGETELTASLEGYSPAQMILEVDGSGPATVTMTQLPTIIEANNFGSESLVISLVDHDGKPVAAQEDTVVYLSSSDPEIAKVEASAVIPAGESHVTSNVRATLRAGETIVTGAAEGLASGSMIFETVGFSGSISEYHLGLYAIPKLPADGREYEAIVVQLQDRAGLPVLAKADVQVSLSSGSSIAGNVQEKVVIPAGSSLTTALFRTSLIEDDKFKITASSEGFTSEEVEIDTTTQPLTLYAASEFPTKADYGSAIRVAVDVYSGSILIRDATVKFTGASANETVSMTDEAGYAEGTYIPTLPGSNSIIIKANKPGYKEGLFTSRISLLQTVTLVMNAQSLAGYEMSAQFKIEGPSALKNQATKPGSPIIYENAKWGSYKITAPSEVKAANAVYTFAQWSDGMTENPRTFNIVDKLEISALYNARYLLQVSDPYAMARGSGYYDEGSTATLAMAGTTIGGILTDKEFDRWSGDITSSSSTTEVVMDGPKTIKAEWKDNYLKLALVATAAIGGGFYYYWKVFKPKRELEAKQRAPDLDWYKS